MQYLIMGTYQGETEEVDTASDRKEAEYLRQEYRLAFGPGWTIKIKPAPEPAEEDPDQPKQLEEFLYSPS